MQHETWPESTSLVLDLAFAIEYPCGQAALDLARTAIGLLRDRDPQDFELLRIGLCLLNQQIPRKDSVHEPAPPEAPRDRRISTRRPGVRRARKLR